MRGNAASLGRQWQEQYHKELQFLLLPINEGNMHWKALIINVRSFRVELWDSLRCTQWPRSIVKRRLEEFLYTFCGRKTWTYSIPAVPCQRLTNCGVFMIEFFRAVICGIGSSSLTLLESAVNEERMSRARHLIAIELKHRQYRIPLTAFPTQFTTALTLRRCLPHLHPSLRRKMLVLSEHHRLVLLSSLFPLLYSNKLVFLKSPTPCGVVLSPFSPLLSSRLPVSSHLLS
jgi:hypothetical protein